MRLSYNQLAIIARRLSTPQTQILALLDQHRYATTRQLARLLQPHYRTAASALRQTARLTRTLADHSLIGCLARRIGGSRGGSAGAIWYTTEAGARLAGIDPAADELTLPRLQPRRRHREPSTTFLAHTLAVTEARLITEETSRTQPLRIQHIETEPACWRRHLGRHGHPETVKPDLAVITETGGYQDHWWYEIDLDTENPARLKAREARYLRHYHSGVEQRQRGLFPAIVWITPDHARRRLIETTFDHQAPHGMFTACHPDELPHVLLHQTTATPQNDQATAQPGHPTPPTPDSPAQ